MPRPPIMPLAYGQTGFRLKIRRPSPILNQLEVAGADLDAISEQEIEDKINDVVSRFLDARQHAVSKPDFRSEVKSLRKGLDSLLARLPDDYSPLAAELGKHWQYAPIGTPAQQYVVEFPKQGFVPALPVIGEQTPIAHLRAELQRFSTGLEALAADVGLGKAGRVEALEEHEFVGALAVLYSEWTGSAPTQGIKETATNPEERATGPFSDFIRAILRVTHSKMVERLSRQGKMVGRGRFEPLTPEEAAELVGPLTLPSLSSLIQALGRN